MQLPSTGEGRSHRRPPGVARARAVSLVAIGALAGGIAIASTTAPWSREASHPQPEARPGGPPRPPGTGPGVLPVPLMPSPATEEPVESAAVPALAPAVPGQAIPLVPAVHTSVGTATVSPADGGWRSQITLSGSIVVGSEEFVGTASGVTDSYLPEGAYTSLMQPFALEGPNLTGTCAGHWALTPGSITAQEAFSTGTGLEHLPARAGWLSCTLQLGQSAPTQTGLALVVAQIPPTPAMSGVFGPGPSAVPVPAPLSLGAVDRTQYSDGGNVHTVFDLVGHIAIGGAVFTGHASGERSHFGGDPAPPFTLAGTSPSGDLSATCTDTATGLPGTSQLECTGQVGSGPVGTTTLLLAIPINTPRTQNPCGRCSTNDATGVFIGA